MKDRELQDYINDLTEACGDILAFTEGMSYSDFVNDKKTINAVIRCLEVMGEAAKKLPASLKDRYPKVPWKQMAGMRNKLVHEYFGIDKQMVWQVVEKHIHDLLILTKEITTD